MRSGGDQGPTATGHGLTGERTAPGIWQENYWYRRHEAAYRLIAEHLPDRGLVLDCGLGDGYGAALLAERRPAARVLGLDCDLAAVRYASRTYERVVVILGNAVALPMRDGCLDALVSSQVVEHLWDQQAGVREAARVLRPGGRLLLTTPNRATFPSGNPWHTRELDASELTELLAPAFDVRLLGLHHGPRLVAADERHGGLVAAQLAGPSEQWSPALAATVSAVTSDDFVVTPRLDGALDLVARARVRPAG